ncbi:MAG: SGNH/GDSL hydrolase family protein [Acidobacteriota bacterium]
MGIRKWQAKFIVGGALILPISPLLYLQGQYTRRKVGLLPDAVGETTGVSGVGDDAVELLVLGESTVAGLGAQTHEKGLAGQFAMRLSERLNRPVRWTAVGKSGVTAQRTIEELLPRVPDQQFDYILLGLGGNDVMKLSSPIKWRREMLRLITMLREKSPETTIFTTNCPAINLSPAIPQPVKAILWELSKMHQANAQEFTAGLDRVYYYDQPAYVPPDFFADGIHPSESGYAAWARSMLKFFDEKYKW